MAATDRIIAVSVGALLTLGAFVVNAGPPSNTAVEIATVESGKYRAEIRSEYGQSNEAQNQRVTLNLYFGARQIGRLRLPPAAASEHQFKLEAISVDNHRVLRFSSEPAGADEIDLVGRDVFHAWFVAERGHALIWSGLVNLMESGQRIEVTDLDGDGRKEIVLGEYDTQLLRCGSSQAQLFPKIWDFSKKRFVAARFDIHLPGDVKEVDAAIDIEKPRTTHFRDIVRFRSSSSDLRDTRQGTSVRVSLPAALGDGEPSTAWIEGASGNGRGEFVTADTSEAFSMVGLRIFPGHGASDATFAAHGQPRRILITFDDGQRLVVRLPAVTRYELAANGGLYVNFPTPVASRCLTVTILDANTAKRTSHTAISEISPIFKTDFMSRAKAIETIIGALTLERNPRKRRDLTRVARSIGPETMIPVQQAFEQELTRSDRAPALSRLLPLLAILPPEGVQAVAQAILSAPDISGSDLAAFQRIIAIEKPEYALSLLKLALNENAPTLSRARAVQIGGRAASPEDVTVLTPLLGKGDGHFRRLVVRGLSRAKITLADTLLDIAAQDPEDTAALDSLWALDRIVRHSHRGQFIPLPGSERILKVYNGTQETVTRMRALRLMNRIKVPAAAAFLITILESKERPELRSLAAIALIHYDNRKSTQALIRALRDTEPSVRFGAVKALRSRPNLPNVSEAIRTYTDTETWSQGRTTAFRVLAESDLRESVDHLYAIAARPPEEQAYEALFAITAARKHARPHHLIPIITDEKRPARLRVKAVQALSYASDPDSETILIDLVHGRLSSAPKLQQTAARALGRRRSGDGLQALLETVTDGSDPKLQRACIRALSTFSAPQALRVLKAMRPDVDLRTRGILEDAIDAITDRLENNRRR